MTQTEERLLRDFFRVAQRVQEIAGCKNEEEEEEEEN